MVPPLFFISCGVKSQNSKVKNRCQITNSKSKVFVRMLLSQYPMPALKSTKHSIPEFISRKEAKKCKGRKDCFGHLNLQMD